LYSGILHGDFITAGTYSRWMFNWVPSWPQHSQTDPFVVQLSGIPAGSTIVAAYANWSYLTTLAPYPSGLGQITINSVPVTGQLTGEANEDLCWFDPRSYPERYTVAYTADITTLVQTVGNGTYEIGSAIDESSSLAEGITLLVVFSNPAQAERQIYVYAGMATTQSGSADGQARASYLFGASSIRRIRTAIRSSGRTAMRITGRTCATSTSLRRWGARIATTTTAQTSATSRTAIRRTRTVRIATGTGIPTVVT
jgi:hypothetical protein